MMIYNKIIFIIMNSYKYLLINFLPLVNDILLEMKKILNVILIAESNPYDDLFLYELTSYEKDIITKQFCTEFNLIEKEVGPNKCYKICYYNVRIDSLYKGIPTLSNIQFLCKKLDTVKFKNSNTDCLCKAIHIIKLNQGKPPIKFLS